MVDAGIDDAADVGCCADDDRWCHLGGRRLAVDRRGRVFGRRAGFGHNGLVGMTHAQLRDGHWLLPCITGT
jgi:hypothetical protein